MYEPPPSHAPSRQQRLPCGLLACLLGTLTLLWGMLGLLYSDSLASGLSFLALQQILFATTVPPASLGALLGLLGLLQAWRIRAWAGAAWAGAGLLLNVGVGLLFSAVLVVRV